MKGNNKNIAEGKLGGEIMPIAAQMQSENVTRERGEKEKASWMQAENQSRTNAVTTVAEKKIQSVTKNSYHMQL